MTERARLLRGLVPKRPLTPGEALRIAELQANRLLRYFHIEPPSRAGARSSANCHASGSCAKTAFLSPARPTGTAATGSSPLNADEPYFRQRFSLMHEFKHVIDHTTKQFLYHDRPSRPPTEQAERVADYFAACLLMPKKVVKTPLVPGQPEHRPTRQTSCSSARPHCATGSTSSVSPSEPPAATDGPADPPTGAL